MKIALLDRDGTIIIDPLDERVDSVDKINLFPDTLDALKLLADNDFAVIIITNQAGIVEGRLDEKEFIAINDEVLKRLESSGIKILKTYMSPHGSKEVNKWRKPGPGMLLKAAEEFAFDLAQVFMVGDRGSDVMAGVNAGTRTILVKTANIDVVSDEAEYTAKNLLEAAKYIVENSK
jgi:histidinol-phosphate phosphatase family protein